MAKTAPQRLPVLPLRDVVVFPHVAMPLLVGRAASLAAVASALAGDKLVLLVAQRSGETQDPVSSDLHRVGTIARILQEQTLPNGTLKVLVEGVGRARVTRYVTTSGHLRAIMAPAPLTLGGESDTVEALGRRAVALFEEYVGLHRRIPGEVLALVQATEQGERQAFAIAAHLGVRLDTRQQLLEADTEFALWTHVTEALGSEIELLRLERKIEDEVRGSLFQNQREFYLQEQLKAIHRELGQEDDDIAELERQVAAAGLPPDATSRAERELRRLRRMSPLSPEASVARNWIDCVLSLPWSARSEDRLDLPVAKSVLDADHYGLDDVKDRILDYLAVLKVVGTLEGPILCLVGPPGVGKTSLGRSIATAMGREFVRMSLGGVRDEAEIRGHRRTYIGAMPGRVLQAMRRAKTMNPVILLDEIDKLGQDVRGDPAAALLEVLDPEQNKAFNDHYLEVDYDLSQVLFVTTANSLGGIPEALRDRMEIIRLSGYLDQEKLAIAQRFLWPRQLRDHGLGEAPVAVDDEVLPAIIRRYTREAGVRELERRLARLARKLARRRAETPKRALHVGVADLHEMLGTAPFDEEVPTREDRVGVANGLAYTSVGGEVLEVEVSAVAGRGRLQLTGTLGEVMKESANAALSYARARAAALAIPLDFYRTMDLHVHVPDGATPKDGPSAGIAMAVAIVSALSGVPARGDVAMTGEVTLRGRVLPIGGLREKAVAAHRSRVTHLIIPKGNARDVDELPDDVKAGLTFHPVETMDQVLALALRATPSVPGPAAPRGKQKAKPATAIGTAH